MEPSHRTSAPHRPAPERSHTWPVPVDQQPELAKKSFVEHLDQHPEDHFLSVPARMHESDDFDDDDDYDDWSSDEDDDDDDDTEDVEWGPGITDFALFESDRRHSRETGQALPQKWNDMLASQASALGRSVERARADVPDDAERSWKDDSVPALTPDVSPHLADDLDVKSYHGQSAPRPIVPSYLSNKQDFVTVLVTPPQSESAIADDDDDDDDNETRLAFFPRQLQRRPRLPPRRPGLSRGSRTLSGKLHVWRRPSLDSWSVQEDVKAESSSERRAEQ